MIRDFRPEDFDAVLAVVNRGADAYRGTIPADRWHEPYMPADDLQSEIDAGVAFRVYEEDGTVIGVMGAQPVKDVLLIRHAYVRTDRQRGGIGAALIADLLAGASAPVLVGTWAAATWAVAFYEKHGFELVSRDEKERLLRTYWSIPDRQIETSVVLRQLS